MNKMINLNAIKLAWHNAVARIASIVTVEPAMILLCMGFMIPGQTFVTILYQKICQNNYSSSSSSSSDRPDVNCYQMSSYPPAVQDRVQQEAATWTLASDGVKTFISLPAILLWSAWADRKRDRIVVMMIPMVGYTILLMVYLLECQLPGMPIWLIVLANGLSSCCGGLFLMINSVNAYLADRFADKKWLAIRFSVIMGCVQVAMLVGSEVDVALTRLRLEISWIIVVGLSLLLLAQVYFGVVLSNPIDYLALVEEEEDEDGDVDGDRRSLSEKPSVDRSTGSPTLPSDHPISKHLSPHLVISRQKSIILSTLDLLMDTYRTFSRPRPQNRRLFIALLVMAAFLAGVSDDGTDNSKNLFLYRRPLNYSLQEYAQLSGGSSAISLVGTLVAATTTKFFGWADTSLAILSLVMNVAGNIIFAFSRTRTMVWMSSVVNCVSFLWGAALRSTVIKLGDPNEQATLIAGTGVAGSLANFVSSLMFNAVYARTEDDAPWVAWVTASGLISIGLVLVVVVHVGLKIEGSSIDNDANGGDGVDNVDCFDDVSIDPEFVPSVGGSNVPINAYVDELEDDEGGDGGYINE